MDIGTYAAASSGVLQMRKLEVQNNNLANINTVGFKGQYVIAEPQNFDGTLASAINEQDPFARADQQRVKNVTEVRTQVDFSRGPIQYTGNPLDVAARDAKDFFVINTPQGPQYTKAGNFTLNAEGQLVTADGLQVQGDGGAIVAQGGPVSVGNDGSVRVATQAAQPPQVVGRIQLVRIEDTTKLVAAEGARFKLQGATATPSGGSMETMSLEMSNVSAITGMVDLITTNRAFDAYTRTAQALDSMNQTAITRVGRRQ
jgi:flagellar basal-body rod protein FlgF